MHSFTIPSVLSGDTLLLPSLCLYLCTLMFQITQFPKFLSFWCLHTPGSGVMANPVAVVLSPGSRALDLESWMDILVDSSSYYRHMHFQTFGLPMLQMYHLFNLHTASIARLSVLGEGSLP